MQFRPTTLPRFAGPRPILDAFADAIEPGQPVTVSECAALHRKLFNPGGYSGPWVNELAPFLVEPMDMCAHTGVDDVVIVGPSQMGKTEVGLNAVAHSAKYLPRDVLILQPTRELAANFLDWRVGERMLNQSPELAAMLGDERGDDGSFEKVLKRGNRIIAAWPVSGQVASRPIAFCWADEYDSMPDDIGRVGDKPGEGTPYKLIQARTKSFRRNALRLVTCSPKRHDRSGIVVLYEMIGDERLLFVACLHCGARFSPGFDDERRPTLAHLYRPQSVDEREIEDKAALMCQSCGGLHDDHERRELVKTGHWVPKGGDPEQGFHPPPRGVSYWLHGFYNPFERIGEIAKQLFQAERELAENNDEGPITGVYNTTLGVPRHIELEQDKITAEVLEARAEAYPQGQVPIGARYVVIAADVQASHFECEARAFGPKWETWVIDRWQIFKPADDERPLDPAAYSEDWDLLHEACLMRGFPLGDGSGRTMRALCTVVDTGGLPGVTGEAYEWALRMTRKRANFESVRSNRICLYKGASRIDAPLTSFSRIDVVRGTRQKRKLGEVTLTVANANRFKDIIFRSLRRTRPGPGCAHFGQFLESKYFKQLTAEKRSNKGEWIKAAKRNESLDLWVMAQAACRFRKVHEIDWTNPQWSWAQEWDRNSLVSDAEPAPEAKPTQQRRPENSQQPRPSGFVGGFKH